MLKKESGSVLILSLWVLMLLGVLATGIAFRARLETQILKIRMARQVTPYAALSEVNEARLQLEADTDSETDSREDTWYGVSEKETFSVEITDQENALNLNTVPPGVLELFFQRLPKEGVKLKTKPEVWTAGILYWRGSSWIKQRAETGAYYKKAPFESLEELFLIPGIEAEDVAFLRNYFTIYPNTLKFFKININTASDFILSLVIDSIPGDSFAAEEFKDRLLQYRRGSLQGPEKNDRVYFTNDDLTTEKLLYRLQMSRGLQLVSFVNQFIVNATVDSQYFTVRVEWPGGTSQPTGVEAILGPVTNTEPNKLSILSWQRT